MLCCYKGTTSVDCVWVRSSGVSEIYGLQASVFLYSSLWPAQAINFPYAVQTHPQSNDYTGVGIILVTELTSIYGSQV